MSGKLWFFKKNSSGLLSTNPTLTPLSNKNFSLFFYIGFRVREIDFSTPWCNSHLHDKCWCDKTPKARVIKTSCILLAYSDIWLGGGGDTLGENGAEFSEFGHIMCEFLHKKSIEFYNANLLVLIKKSFYISCFEQENCWKIWIFWASKQPRGVR